MEGYFPGLLRPPPVPGAGHPGGHPGPPPIGGVGPPGPSGAPPTRPGLIPSLPGYAGAGLGLAPGLGLPPNHPYSSLYASDPLHAELYAREAQRAAELQKGLDMHRLVESQRLESLRQAEARASSFLSTFSKDPLQSLLPGPPPPPGPATPLYADHLRERELRERNALVQSAFGMGSLYHPPPSDLYPPTPVTSPAPGLFTPGIPRPEISPRNLSSTSPLSRSRDLHPSSSSPKVSLGSASPFLPPSTNNSGLADKLKLGFGDRSPSTPASLTRPDPASSDSIKREGPPGFHDGFLRPSGPPTHTLASSSSTLVTSSSHSGLNFPLSHLGPSSKLSQGSPSPWKQPSLQSKPSTTTSTSVIDDKNDDIQIIEEEEEVLIDDFDGQCCRTYPYNHSKIQRWREERRKKNEERRIKEHKKDHDHRDTSKHVDNAGVVKVPTTSIESSVSSSKQSCDTITTTAGTIPVGIVSARQRLDAEKTPVSSHRPSLPEPTSTHRPPLTDSRCSSLSDLGSMPLPPSGPLVSTHGMGPSTWSSGPPPPWPPTPGPPGGPPYSSPWGPPVPPPGMGPIPMGYQLAKDPMTGQILLIPTDPSQAARAGGPPMWPGYDTPTTTPPHLHHMMQLQQQQHLQYMQHSQDILQHQIRQSSAGLPPPPHKAPRIPETITVSDDDDEEDEVARSKPASDTNDTVNVPVTEPTPVQVKIEPTVVKTEFKVEVGDTESETAYHGVTDLSIVKTDVPDAPSDLSMSIKQERSSSISCEDPTPVIQRELPVNEEEPRKSQDSLLQSDPEPLVLKREIKTEPDTPVVVSSGATETLELSDESKLCAETLVFMSECSNPPTCNSDGLQQPQPSDPRDGNDFNGFDILFEGLELLTKESSKEHQDQTKRALDLLCSVTRNDTFEYGLPKEILTDNRLDLDLLCSITAEEYWKQTTAVDPLMKLKSEYNVYQYCTEALETEAKTYIAQKIRQFTKDHPETVELEKYDNIKSLAKMVKKIKNMEIMSQLEVDLRLKITELQNKYRENQKYLSKLKTPRKKNFKNKKGKQRGPGRPKKKKFPNPKAKMGRPRKHPKIEPKMVSEPSPPSIPLELELQTKVKLEEEESFADSDAPPILEPQQELSPRLHLETDTDYESFNRGHQGLLKPPRLTASSPPPCGRENLQVDSSLSDSRSSQSSNTTLSTLTSKFMKGKANPFANLLSKLNSGPSGPSEGVPMPSSRISETSGVTMEQPPTSATEMERSSSEKSSDDSGSETGSMMSPTRDSSFKFGKTSKLGYGLEAFRHMKKRKAEKPKKHSGGSSETIVPKKPKNLFMMMDFQRGFSSKTAEDEYNFDEHEEEEFNQKPSFEYREPRKSSPTPSIKSHESHYQEWTDEDLQPSPSKRKHKKSKLFKSKGIKKERSPSQSSNSKRDSEEIHEPLRSAQLSASDLKDGLRMLILQEGKFWPARLNSTKLPDVYGVVMDRQRGNRPIILPRDDILKEAVLEIRPRSVHQLPIGSRVCTVWSSAYICLFPGTIVTPDEALPDNHVLVELDDGDSRLVEVEKIRMLPSDYSRVVYDPDPISSLRRRRVSTDSHDSVASHGDLRAGYESIKKPSSSKLADTSSHPAGEKKKSSDKMKKKHKKHHKHRDGHHSHHCHKSHKHKRHKSGESSGRKQEQTKFVVRSPLYVKSDPEDHETSEAEAEISHDESEHHNSSDEEGTSLSSSRAPHPDLASNKGRELWSWAGEGYKRPGGKGKSKKLFFKSIQRGKDVLHVNDCAVFLSTGRSDRPYIGKIEMLWETSQASMMCKVKWFYHPEEIETCGRKFDLKLPGGLFQSPHTDENSVHTISHKCEVLPIKEFTRFLQSDSKKRSSSYYLAGSYDPAGLSVHFQPGVLKSTDSD